MAGGISELLFSGARSDRAQRACELVEKEKSFELMRLAVHPFRSHCLSLRSSSMIVKNREAAVEFCRCGSSFVARCLLCCCFSAPDRVHTVLVPIAKGIITFFGELTMIALCRGAH